MFNDFKGAAKPLDSFDVAQLAHRIDVGEDHFQAFLNVESRSRGFERGGRPIILNEPHVFYRNLTGTERAEAVAAGLAYKSWGTKPYPKTQDERYEWLAKAIKINEAAALKSCSWGMSQILGENYALAGYATPQQMVLAFMADEEEHVEGMMKYILATGIADDLRHERWDVVARVYNGPSYKKNGYHTKMAQEFRKLRGQADSGWAPDQPDPRSISITDTATMKAVQGRLHDLGYHEVGNIDGIYGTKLRAGVLAFRADNGLPIIADIDEELLAALMVAEKRAISDTRTETTVADVRAQGSRQIDAADKTQITGWIVAIGGLLTSAQDVIGDPGNSATDFLALYEKIMPLVEELKGMSPYMALALGALIIWQQMRIKGARVDDVQKGIHVGRG